MGSRIRLLAVGCLVMLAACSNTLDSAQLESEIAAQLGERFPDSAWTVVCPDDVEPQAGASFGCSATSADDQAFSIQVTQENAEGSVTWRIVEG
jgi:hypothetical protein